MYRALFFPLEPFNNAPFMELAETFQSDQRLANLVLLHADSALLRTAIMPKAILLSSCKGEHSHRGGRLRNGTATVGGRARSGTMTFDALPNMCFPSILVPVHIQRRKNMVTNRAKVSLVYTAAGIRDR